MKKSLIALAALAAAGVASAQSSVTIFGVLDAAVTHSSVTGNGSVTVMREGAYNSSRLGFRGTEDLGGGMNASFWLEMGIQTDNGAGYNSTSNNTSVGDRIAFNSSPAAGTTAVYPQSSLGARQGLTFNRRSTVSLAGGWGELRVGRDYVPTFWNQTVFDPFGTLGVGGLNNISQGNLNPRGSSAFPPGQAAPFVRSSNSIGYFLPANLGGIYGQAMYALSEQPSQCGGAVAVYNGQGTLACNGSEGDGRYIGARLGYASGPFDVAGAWSRTRYTSAAGATATAFGFTPGAFTPTTGAGAVTAAANLGAPSQYTGNWTQWNIAGSWNFGVAKLMGHYGRQDTASTAAIGDRSLRYWMIGGLVPVGAGEIRASYSTGKRADSGAGGSSTQANLDGAKLRQWAIGYVHNFSKRTAVYATYANQRASGAVAASVMGLQSTAGGHATGYDLGIRHSF